MNQTSNIIGLATIPKLDYIIEKNTPGKCIVNPDGGCIAGGKMISGTSGYDLQDFQASGTGKCSAFPLFCTVSMPYTATSQGYQCSTNAVQLAEEIHRW